MMKKLFAIVAATLLTVSAAHALQYAVSEIVSVSTSNFDTIVLADGNTNMNQTAWDWVDDNWPSNIDLTASYATVPWVMGYHGSNINFVSTNDSPIGASGEALHWDTISGTTVTGEVIRGTSITGDTVRANTFVGTTFGGVTVTGATVRAHTFGFDGQDAVYRYQLEFPEVVEAVLSPGSSIPIATGGGGVYYTFTYPDGKSGPFVAYFALGTGIYTAPYDGFYRVTQFSTYSSVSTFVAWLYAAREGVPSASTQIGYYQRSEPGPTARYHALSGATVIYLDATDELTVMYSQLGATTQTLMHAAVSIEYMGDDN